MITARVQRLAVLVCISGASCGWPRSPEPTVHAAVPQDVSMIQLIANQKAFSGKMVRVVGFCHLEFEGNALYLHKEDFDLAIGRNAIRLDAPADKKALSDRYVLIEGIFEDAENEYEAGFSGRLTKISRMEPALSRADWEKLSKR